MCSTSQQKMRSTNALTTSVVAIGLTLTGLEPTWAGGVFDAFLGSWNGSGTITSTGGGSEPVRCKSSFRSTDGNRLAVTVVCASDSYKFNLSSSVVAQGDQFSGSWQEETRQVQGDVRGTMSSPDTMQASLDALGGGVQIGARANGKQMAITIQSQGSEVRDVKINLRRS